MLKTLHLNNFQIHKELHLEFTSGVNVIKGTSDSGKSSIIRAFTWLCHNKPAGSAFIRRGAAACSVVLSVLPGGKADLDVVEVGRFREKGFNGYRIGEEKFNAVSSSVPEEVTKFLGIGPINIQAQHDPFFLLQASASEVAKELNAIAGLSCIDDSLARVNSLVRETGAQIHAIKEQKTGIADALELLSWTDKAQDAVTEAETVERECTDLGHKKGALQEYINVLRDVFAEVDANTDFIECVNSSQLLAGQAPYEEIAKKESALYEVVQEIKVHQQAINSSVGDKHLEALLSAEALRVDVESRRGNHTKLSTQVGQLREAAAALRLKTDQLDDVSQQIKQAEARCKVCPTCKRPM